MRRLRLTNPALQRNYQTYLSADYSTGTAVTVINNNSFAANDLGVFGDIKEELTELKKISSLGTTVTLNIASALNFAHPKGTPVYKSLWDFVSIEGRSSSAGVFAELTQSGLQWDNKQGETVYFHSAGDDNWQYRYRFYNSATLLYSEYSPTLTGAGFTRKQVGYMLREVRKITNCPDQTIVTDDEIIRQFNRAQDIIYAHNPRYWFLLVDTYKGANPIACATDTYVYSLAQYTTLGHLSSIRYRYTSGATDELYTLMKKSDVEFDKFAVNLNEASNDYAEIFKILPADSASDQGYLHIFPKSKTSTVGKIYPNYYEKMADLDSVDDVTQVSLPEIIEDYAIGYVYRVKGDEARADNYQSGLNGATIRRNGRALFIEPQGLKMLDQLDEAQKQTQGQPRSLSNFKGRIAMSRLYGSPRYGVTRDQIKEDGTYDERMGY